MTSVSVVLPGTISQLEFLIGIITFRDNAVFFKLVPKALEQPEMVEPLIPKKTFFVSPFEIIIGVVDLGRRS